MLGDREGVAITCHDLALAHVVESRFAAAKPLMAESLQLCSNLEQVEDVVSPLEGMGVVAVGLGTYEPAVRLLGAAEALREPLAGDAGHPDVELHAWAIAEARTCLGREAFEAAFEAGRALSRDQAVELALSL